MGLLPRLLVSVECFCAFSANLLGQEKPAPAAPVAASGTLGTVDRLDPRMDEYVP